MEYEILNELIDMPKKAEASKAKKKLFVEQMVLLLSEEGFSANAIKYLRSGFTFAGAKPVAIYLQKTSPEKRSEEISRLLTSELFRGGDKVAAFRFGISLSAYSIEWFGDDQILLIELIKVLPYVSKNKERQLLKDAPKIFEKYFLDVVSDSTKLPVLDISGLKEIHIREYRQMMSEIISRVSEGYQNRAARVGAWIGVETTPKSNSDAVLISEEKAQSNIPVNSSSEVGASAATGSAPTIETSGINTTTDTGAAVEKAIMPLSKKELVDAVALLGEFSARLGATISLWTASQKELETAKGKIAVLSSQLQHSETLLSSEKQHSEHLSTELSHRSSMLSELQAQYLEAKAIISNLEKQLEESLKENARLNSIISVYSSDKQNSQSEQLNAIASKLKSEYRDFKDVESEEMTIDLGENFRFQLQSIFRILAKAGIDVERR